MFVCGEYRSIGVIEREEMQIYGAEFWSTRLLFVRAKRAERIIILDCVISINFAQIKLGGNRF